MRELAKEKGLKNTENGMTTIFFTTKQYNKDTIILN